jgi:hypothetical protein
MATIKIKDNRRLMGSSSASVLESGSGWGLPDGAFSDYRVLMPKGTTSVVFCG